MLTLETVKRIAYSSVIESLEESFKAVQKADLARSVRQRAEDFHVFLSKYGILSTLSYYISKACDDKAYEELLGALSGTRGTRSIGDKDLSYAVLVKVFFDYFTNLAKRSEIPEICSLINKVSPCTPTRCHDFIHFLRKLIDLDPYEKTLLTITLREFAESIKSVSRIYAAETG